MFLNVGNTKDILR